MYLSLGNIVAAVVRETRRVDLEARPVYPGAHPIDLETQPVDRRVQPVSGEAGPVDRVDPYAELEIPRVGLTAFLHDRRAPAAGQGPRGRAAPPRARGRYGPS